MILLLALMSNHKLSTLLCKWPELKFPYFVSILSNFPSLVLIILLDVVQVKTGLVAQFDGAQ